MGPFHSLSGRPRIVNMSMRGDSRHKESEPVPASVADDSSSDARSSPAARGAAGARGTAPRAHDDPDIEVIYSGESDVSDSGNAAEASRSPATPQCSAVMTNLMMSMFAHHRNQLVLLRTRDLTMVQPIVILITVVPTKVPP